MDAMDTRKMQSIFAVNKYLPIVASCWILSLYSKCLYSTVKFKFLSFAIDFPYKNSRKLEHVRKLGLQKIYIRTDKYSLLNVFLPSSPLNSFTLPEEHFLIYFH